jgi:hypothetical protein
MLKKFIFTVIIFSNSYAWANWINFGGNSILTVYIDPASLRKDGNFRKIWQLQDLQQRDKDGEFSRRVRMEYDCKNERFRALSWTMHSAQMAQGEILSDNSKAAQWSDIPPGTIADDILKLVCTK